jgi:release factor glutamine methyltransferase
MIPLLEIIRRSEKYLANCQLQHPRREAEEVIASILGIKRLDLYLQFDRPFAEEELPILRQAIQRRGRGEPVAYIAGKVSFGGISLNVNRSVLIPRQETEILVEKIASCLKKLDLKNKVLWDLCCGSGCMGLALKNRFPELEVILSDLSEEALAVAASNAQSPVFFKQGNLFAPFSGMKCDFFVCNPPYITQHEYASLEREVKDWEPKQALLAGDTGLEFYSRIAKELKNYLNPHGLAWLELGTGQGPTVSTLFQAEGWVCTVEPDWSGHDRFFHCQL